MDSSQHLADWALAASGPFFPLISSTNPGSGYSSDYFVLEHCSDDASGAATSAYCRLAPVETVSRNIAAIGEEREVLRRAVSNLWEIHRYNQHYVGYLTGGVSEDDYNAAAERYARSPEEFSSEYLKSAAQIVLPLIRDDDLTPNDLALVLNTSPDQLELALEAAS